MLETAFNLTQTLAFVTGETGAIAGALADGARAFLEVSGR